MRTYKKRIITDVVSVGMLLLAVGLKWLCMCGLIAIKIGNFLPGQREYGYTQP